MDDAVKQGFIQKCAELGINPSVMAKYAAATKKAWPYPAPSDAEMAANEKQRAISDWGYIRYAVG